MRRRSRPAGGHVFQVRGASSMPCSPEMGLDIRYANRRSTACLMHEWPCAAALHPSVERQLNSVCRPCRRPCGLRRLTACAL